ncbi:MAG TPA: hypothetical protein DCO77_14575 [Nitrospiraceae bacterium]|nr:hypothetical protein [Nitrospiraceae bacterium]
MARTNSPKFTAGRNIAMKVPAHEFEATVIFYRDIIGLPLAEGDEPGIVFAFGDKQLWIDRADHLSQAEIWLEIRTDDVRVAEKYCRENGIVRRDEIENLPPGFEGFWISSPANIIHLVSGE